MLKLQPAPTFKAKVIIPIPGQDTGVQVVCEFRHMTRDAFEAFSASEAVAARTDVESLLALLVGWEGIDAAFGPDAVALLVQQYHGAAYAIVSAYAAELTKARSKN